ncbi:MAG: RNA methyltransferase [Bacteroidetes bacterium CG2_30_33_31]|nr:MAG: RNA methyltransferase [Bacteroidetes bacterium CG2_30_33_31]
MRKLENIELNRMDVDEFKKSKKIPLTIILDNIRSLSNVGSVFRTSDAFLVKEIILCGITAKPPQKEIQKTALGATDSVDWRYFESTFDAVKELQSKGTVVWAVEQAEEKLWANSFDLPKKDLALVFGNEVKGVSEEVMSIVDDCVEIPQFGTKHSLNISISAGIMIWEIFKKLDRKKGD